MYFECHGHIFMNGTNFRAAKQLYEKPGNEMEIRKDIRDKLAACKAAGIVYFRDGGDPYSASVIAGKIAPEYGIEYRTPVFAIHRKGCYGGIVGRGFSDMREYTALVREAVDEKADFIKVIFSGILDLGSDGHITDSPFGRDQIREMIHIVHEEGLAVMAHANGAETVKNVILGGADSLEHGHFMDEDCLHILAESETVWVPTNIAIHNLLVSDRYDKGLIREVDDRQAGQIRAAASLGAKIAPGSDAGAFMVSVDRGAESEETRLLEILMQSARKKPERAGHLQENAEQTDAARKEPELIEVLRKKSDPKEILRKGSEEIQRKFRKEM